MSRPDPVEFRQKLAAQTRARVTELGAPIFVPAGSTFRGWRIGGGGSESVEVRPGETSLRPTSVHAGCQWLGRGLEVTTSVHAPHRSNQIAQLLARSVQDDPELPFSLTVSERDLSVPVVGRRDGIPLAVVDSGFAWSATGTSDGRHVTLEGVGVAIESVRLRLVTDLATIDDSRW